MRYQFSLGDVVRECGRQGSQIAIKVGVEGRVLIGPVGAPGSFSAPVRVAIRRESDQKPATSKSYHVAVTVLPGSAGMPFSLVTEPILVPFISPKADEDYTIVVGFDEVVGEPTRAARKPQPRK